MTATTSYRQLIYAGELQIQSDLLLASQRIGSVAVARFIRNVPERGEALIARFEYWRDHRDYLTFIDFVRAHSQ